MDYSITLTSNGNALIILVGWTPSVRNVQTAVAVDRAVELTYSYSTISSKSNFREMKAVKAVTHTQCPYNVSIENKICIDIIRKRTGNNVIEMV